MKVTITITTEVPDGTADHSIYMMAHEASVQVLEYDYIKTSATTVRTWIEREVDDPR